MVSIIPYLVGLVEGTTSHTIVNIRWDDVTSLLAQHLVLSKLFKLVTAILFSTEQIVVTFTFEFCYLASLHWNTLILRFLCIVQVSAQKEWLLETCHAGDKLEQME